MPASSQDPVALACWAMATRFEILLYDGDPVALRAAGEEALHEIQRLESQLNLYAPTSEISALNAKAGLQPVRVQPALFQLLQHARQLNQETLGAFDITIAPLLQCWGFLGGSGHLPNPDQIDAARQCVGMEHLQLDPDASTVRFLKPGMKIDLGAIGKGFAIDAAADILRENAISSALIHGGTSTCYALGTPPGQDHWKVAIEFPDQPAPAPLRFSQEAPAPDSHALLAIVPLRDESLSVSAVWGKAFQSDHTLYGHVLDPRTGLPARNAMLAAAALPSATESDALSTALLVGGPGEQTRLRQLRPNLRSLVAGKDPQSHEVWLAKSNIE